MKRVPENLNPVTITQQDDLAAVCERLAQAGSFAFDTEFIMEDGYQSSVCLIQVATESEVALIDPLADIDTTPFWELVVAPHVSVSLHAGMEDLALCYQLTGKVPANVFDVQIAAGLVGGEYPLSLRRLVQSMLRVRLHKSQTLTDWRRRPLTDAQRSYAVEDVAYVPALHHVLTRRLKRAGRLEWAREEFARFEREATYEPPKQARLQRLKGAGSLDPQGLAVASELLDEREALAEHYDRPARAVVRDHLLVEIARNRWTSPQQICSLRGLHVRRSGIQRLAEAVKRGLAVPREQWPAPPESVDDTPEEVMLTALLTAVLRSFCHGHRLAFSLLATRQSIRDLVHERTRRGRSPSLLSQGWRAEAVGELLGTVLNGQAALRVTGTRTRPRLEVEAGPPSPAQSAPET